jgi:alkylation response protein AidB-like acyl-CoA dehydrogenase
VIAAGESGIGADVDRRYRVDLAGQASQGGGDLLSAVGRGVVLELEQSDVSEHGGEYQRAARVRPPGLAGPRGGFDTARRERSLERRGALVERRVVTLDLAVSRSAESIVTEARTIAREHLASLVAGYDRHTVNRPLVRALADTGLSRRLFGVRFGGSATADPSALVLCALREGLAEVSTAASTALALQLGGGHALARHAGEELAERWVPPIVAGDAIAAFAITEPDRAGSDAGALALSAVRAGAGWTLAGEKVWIMNAPDVDVYTVFARTAGANGARGVTAFAVPADTPGLSAEPLHTLWPYPIGRVIFDAVTVPEANVLGELGAGLEVAMRTFDLFRPSVAGFCVGFSQAALDAAVAYARRREAFGRPIAEYQAVSHQLAEMETRLHAARLLSYDAAMAFDAGRPRREVARRSAMAKLHATETAQFVVDAALQIHGAVGTEEGHLLEHLYREARAARIYEGTSEIQRTIIARDLLA